MDTVLSEHENVLCSEPLLYVAVATSKHVSDIPEKKFRFGAVLAETVQEWKCWPGGWSRQK